MIPESNLYEFRQRLSENVHTQAWLAVRRDSGRPCFVKCVSEIGDLPVDEKREILRRSYRLQSRIRSSLIHTAVSLHADHGNIFVEYPYFSDNRLSEVSLDLLLDPSTELFVRLAVITDYLHFLGLVHCDLKLENFRLLKHARGQRLILVDLDNIQESGQPSGHRVFGSIDWIPPEILKNDRICGGSDLYSLGCSIRAGLKDFSASRGPAAPSKDTTDRLQNLIERMTEPSPAARPEMLLRGLRTAELITDGQYRQALKTTLSAMLLNQYHSLRATGEFRTAALQQDLFYASKLCSLPSDFCDGLQRTLAAEPRKAFTATKDVVAGSRCERCGEFWYVSIPDEVLLKVFATLPDGAEFPPAVREDAPKLPPESDRDSDPVDVVQIGKGLRGYLEQKVRVDAQIAAGSSVSAAELRDLAERAISLLRPQEACEYFRQAIEAAVTGSIEQIRLLLLYVPQLFAANEYDRGGAAIDRGMELARRGAHKVEELEFRRQRAWLIGHNGDLAESVGLLLQVAQEAADLQLREVQVKATSDRAGLLRAAGRLEEAAVAYDQALATTDGGQIESYMLTALLGSASLCFMMAQYRKAITRAKTALKYVDPRRQSYMIPYVYDRITISQTRLAEHDKADYWLGRGLGLIHASAGHTGYAHYYASVGWTKMVRGDLAEAEVSFRRVLDIIPQGKATSLNCYTLRNLCEIALYRGDVTEFDRLADQTRKALAECYDGTADAELGMLVCLRDFYYDPARDLNRLGPALQILADRGCRYYAAVTLYLALIESDHAWRDKNSARIRRVIDLVPSDQTPVFLAIHDLMSGYTVETASTGEMIAAFRRAYRRLESSGQWFLAMVTCAGIARLHFSDHQPRLGARFIRQALSLAERLSNHRFVQLFNERLKEESSLVQERRILVQSFDGIADILSNVSQEMDPLPRLLKFAVEAVEAERGVLLVCSPDSDELRVRNFIGCEADDLEDVVNFSRNIPRMAIATMSPVFISDALADAAIKKYRSIVAHNIRSVICVPIAVDGRARGVIYLDHHTIPALFDAEDLTFVSALSKFASLVFDTYAKYRSSKHLAEYLESGLTEIGIGSDFVTCNESLKRLLGPLPQIAASDASVLIRGESGTGKEIVCRMIHAASSRKDAPFVKLNCAAIAPTLVESELFGVAERTATGVGARKGKFEAGDGGTLFLDEIGDMPLAVQAKVLRVLEYQEFEPVGSNTTLKTDVRFIYATNKNLAEMVEKKRFRQDLYYRISGVEITIPPLRDRPDDVEPLCNHFIALFAKTTHKPIRLSGQVLSILESYLWPGNVRELRNVIERLSLLYPGRTILPADLPADMISAAIASESTGGAAEASEKSRVLRELAAHNWDQSAEAVRLAGSPEALERARIVRALVRHNWNQSAAARFLKMPLSTLRRKIKKYGIRRP